MQIPRLREWREARALTQEELAGRAGLSARSVAGYEAGSGARPGSVRKLAAALEIDVPDLTGACPKVPAPPSSERTLFNGVLEEERRCRLIPWVRYVTRRLEWYEDLFGRPPGEFISPLSSLDTAVLFAMDVGTDLARIKDTVRELTALDPDAEEVRELVEVSDRFAGFVERVDARVSEMVERSALGAEEREQRLRVLRVIDGQRSA